MPSRKSRTSKRKEKQRLTNIETALRRANKNRQRKEDDVIPVDQAITIPKKHWKKLKIDTCLLHDIAAEGTPCQVENWQTKQPLPAQVLNVDDKEKKIQDRDQPCSAPSEHQIVNNNTGGHVSLAGKQIIRQDQNQNFIEVPTKRTLENGRHVEVITCFPNVTVKELLQYRKPKTPRISKEKNGSYEKFVIHDTGEDTSMETDSWISQFNRNVSPLDSSSAPAGTSERLESNNNASNSMSLKPATITSSQAANLDNVFKLPKAPLRPAAMNTLPAGNFDSAFKIPKVPKKPAAMTRNQAGNVDSAFKISEVPMKPATITTAQASNLDKAFNFPHVSRSNHVANTEEGEKSEGQANSGAVAPAAACPFTATNPFYPFGFGDRCSEDCPRCEARLNGPKLELHPAEKAKLRRDHGKSLRAKFNEKVKALYERQWFHRQNLEPTSYFSNQYCPKELAAYKWRLKNPTAVEVQAALDAGYNTNYGVPHQFIRVEKPMPLPRKGAVLYGDEPLPTIEELNKAVLESLQEATLELPTSFYL